MEKEKEKSMSSKDKGKAVKVVKAVKRCADVYKYFPHDSPRPGQEGIISNVREFIESGDRYKGMILSGDPGLGKEACMTSQAILALVEGRFDRVIFAIPTDSGKLNILKEIESVSHKLNVLKISSKNNLCEWMKDRNDDRISAVEGDGCGFMVCKSMKNECKYHGNSCPYEKQKEDIMNADILICDYNYIISPFIRRFTGIGDMLENEKVLLLVDECHKLPDRAEIILSSSISSNTIKHAVLELEKFTDLDAEHGFKKEKLQLQKLSEGLATLVNQHMFDLKNQVDADYTDYGKVTTSYSALKAFCSSGDMLVSAGLKISRAKFRSKQGIVSYVEYVGDFLKRLEDKRQYIKNSIFFVKLKKDMETAYIGWSPVTVTAYVRSSLERAEKFILYSGTCHPTDRFQKTMGLKDLDIMTPERFKSPFLHNRKDIVLSNALFRAVNRMDNTFVKKARHNISKIIDAMPDHTAIVCTRKWFSKLELQKHYDILEEPVTQEEVEDWVETKAKKAKLIHFSPYGRVAQSVDMSFLRGIIMVGFPLKSYDAVMQERSARLEKLYKGGSGNARFKANFLLLTAPGWQAVIQSVMRGLRSEDDKIIAVYYDAQYRLNRNMLESQNLSMCNNVKDVVKEISSTLSTVTAVTAVSTSNQERQRVNRIKARRISYK